MSRNYKHSQIHFWAGANHTHTFRDGQTYTEKVGICGKRTSSHLITEDFAKITCPECSSRHAKNLLAAQTINVGFGGAAANTRDYRSIRQVMFDGEVVGHLTMHAGWGQKWMLHPLLTSYTGKDLPEDDDIGRRYDYVGTYRSKEAALLDVPDFVAKGVLWKASEGHLVQARRLEAIRKLREERETAEAKAEAEAAARRAERERHTTVLGRMVGYSWLTQEQKEALAWAHRQLTPR